MDAQPESSSSEAEEQQAPPNLPGSEEDENFYVMEITNNREFCTEKNDYIFEVLNEDYRIKKITLQNMERLCRKDADSWGKFVKFIGDRKGYRDTFDKKMPRLF